MFYVLLFGMLLCMYFIICLCCPDCCDYNGLGPVAQLLILAEISQCMCSMNSIGWQ